MRNSTAGHYEANDAIGMRYHDDAGFVAVFVGDATLYVKDAEIGVFADQLGEVIEQLKTIAHDVRGAT